MRLVAIALTMTAVASLPAQAQTTQTPEFSAGYQFTHFPDTNVPGGWYADYAVPVNSMWAAFGEVNGAYKEGDKLHVYGGGVRYVERRNPQVVPFGQILAGAATFSGGGDTQTKFALQIGGGVNIPVNDMWDVRVGADYRRVFIGEDQGGGENEFRFVVGIVLPIGQ